MIPTLILYTKRPTISYIYINSFKSVVRLVEKYRDGFESRNMKLHNPTPLCNCYLSFRSSYLVILEAKNN
ncbi:hypothetical protein BpHYR1_024641 [Brachionus plicatilis]|uniref:Uncharacterized protein n=1 Tax=Brachionus plicatilis TaxID=10195 RepID=A0A3M7SGR8_BRAPC|nr:hypothetical protein BpHYR1_024641 [Brachionus plicatilis]